MNAPWCTVFESHCDGHFHGFHGCSKYLCIFMPVIPQKWNCLVESQGLCGRFVLTPLPRGQPPACKVPCASLAQLAHPPAHELQCRPDSQARSCLRVIHSLIHSFIRFSSQPSAGCWGCHKAKVSQPSEAGGLVKISSSPGTPLCPLPAPALLEGRACSACVWRKAPACREGQGASRGWERCALPAVSPGRSPWVLTALTLFKLALNRVIPSNTTSLEVLPSSVGPWGGDRASGSASSAPSEG